MEWPPDWSAVAALITSIAALFTMTLNRVQSQKDVAKDFNRLAEETWALEKAGNRLAPLAKASFYDLLLRTQFPNRGLWFRVAGFLWGFTFGFLLSYGMSLSGFRTLVVVYGLALLSILLAGATARWSKRYSNSQDARVRRLLLEKRDAALAAFR